jgi:hypothetical protein
MPFMPPIEWLRERFYLCPQGVLRHAKSFPNAPAGSPAAFKTRDGYWKVNVTHDGVRKKLAAHRVIWSLDKGRAVPDHLHVDHDDIDPDNNHPRNLVARTKRANQLNKKKKGTGVSQVGENKFRSKISVHDATISLGTFPTWAQANHQYKLALAGKHPKVTREMLKGKCDAQNRQNTVGSQSGRDTLRRTMANLTLADACGADRPQAGLGN